MRIGYVGLLLTTLSLVGGCVTQPPVADARPADLPREALASAAYIGTRTFQIELQPGENGAMQFVRHEKLDSASGVLLGENLLLTNAHVWAKDGEMPAQRSFWFRRPLRGGPPVEHTFELVASTPPPARETGTRSDADGEDSPPDWALARCLDATWDPGEVARPHPDAADPAWQPPVGTELLVVGYSPIFMPRTDVENGDEAPRSALELAEQRASAGPFVIRGDSFTFRGRCALTYPGSWPRPHGHSGGPVFVRDPRDGSLQLIGVFHTHVYFTPSSADPDDKSAVLGLLVYDPLAEVLAASPSCFSDRVP